MIHTAFFRFSQTLNDFLPFAKKNQLVTYSFKENPAIKDAIEAIGIPHAEVDFIIVNGSPVDFLYKLNNNDTTEVYPIHSYPSINKSHSLTPAYVYPLAFIADVNLGKLAKALRILGIDTSYQNDYEDKTVVRLAEEEDRIILTRDIGLLKHKSAKWGYWLRSQQVEKQLEEVLSYFNLISGLMPFKRCIVCNGLIEGVAKETVLDKIPPKTVGHFNEFFQCSCCRKIYWKGSHYENMLEWVEKFKNKVH